MHPKEFCRHHNENSGLGEGGRGIAVAADGSVYTTGYFYGTADFDPGPGTYELTSAGDWDIFVAKLDSDGNFVWAGRMGAAEGDGGHAIAVAADGSVYAIGDFQGTADFDPGPDTYELTSAGWEDVFVTKLDSDGNFVWAGRMGAAGRDYGGGIAVAADGSVSTTGRFSYTADFDPGPGTYELTSAGSFDIFVSKLDAGGNFLWARSMGGESYDAAEGIAVAADGSVHITGWFYGTADFDPGPGAYELSTPAGSNSDIFVSKLDSDGDFLWARNMGGTLIDGAHGIAVAVDSSVHITGYFRGTADFDPGTGTYELSSSSYSDVFVSKLDAQGSFLWAGQMGAEWSDHGYGIVVAADGSVSITGSFRGTGDFDPGPGTRELTSGGRYDDIFVCKLVHRTVGNLVWNDLNADGLQDPGEPGIRGAIVELFDESGVLAGMAVTNDQGIYGFFDTLPETNYYLRFRPPLGDTSYAFTRQNVGGDDTLDSDADAYGVSGMFVRALGQDNFSIDAGLVETTIGDLVWNDLNGDGLQDLDEPGMENVRVRLYSAEDDLLKATTRTDILGIYRFHNLLLLPGDYYLDFTLPSGFVFVQQDAGDDALDSDADPNTGRTANFSIAIGDENLSRDAGMIGETTAFGYGTVSTDSEGLDEGRAVAADPMGNTVMVGRFTNTIDLDPSGALFELTSAGEDDVYIAKYGSAGTLLWAHRIGGPGSDLGLGVTIDEAFNVYVTGSFHDTVDFDPGAGVYELTSAGGSDAFVVRLDRRGNFLHARSFGGQQDDAGLDVALDGQRNIYVTGSFRGTAQFDAALPAVELSGMGASDVFVAKLDIAGNFRWAKRIGGPGADEGSGIDVDASDRVHVTGTFCEIADVDPGPGTDYRSSAGGSDVFLVRLDTDGKLLWARTFGGPGEDTAGGIAVDDLGAAHLAGRFEETVDFDPGLGSQELTSSGAGDIFTAKFDPAGQLAWARCVGEAEEDRANAVAVDLQGNVYLTGMFEGTGVDFDPSETGVFRLDSLGFGDLFIWKLDSDGEFRLAQPVAGESGDEEGFGIAVDTMGHIYFTGVFSSLEIFFDPSSDIPILKNSGDDDIGGGELEIPNTIADFVWHDLDQNGLQHSDLEWGLMDVTVKLFTSQDVLEGITTTNLYGEYNFPLVPPGEHYVEFTLPNDYQFTQKDAAGNTKDALDSDANESGENQGQTDPFSFAFNEANYTIDAGMTRAVNHLPVAVDDSASVDEDQSVNIPMLANDTDEDGDPLYAVSASDVSHGTLSLGDSEWIYVPNENYHGADSFTYYAHDGIQQSEQPALVTITVQPLNDPPSLAGPIPPVNIRRWSWMKTIPKPCWTSAKCSTIPTTARA